jgi:ATP-dependent exoDNAse (exonuclease V) beta subunit
MTIHKAKGLDFSVVFLPFAGITAEMKDKLFIDDSNRIFYLKSEEIKFTRNISQIYSMQKAKILLDELNTFYVACTRAKDELFIYIPPKIGSANNLLLKISPFSDGTESEWGEKQKTGEIDGKESTEKTGVELFKQKIITEWGEKFTGLKSREKLINSIYVEDKPAVEIGKSVHAILASIHRKVPESLNSVLNNEEVKKRVEAVINSEPLKQYFQPDEKTRVYCEIEVIDRDGETKRIDRMLVNEDSVTILDFKTGSTENFSRDRKQVTEYCESIKGIYPEKRIKGIIVYIEPLKIVEVA